MDKIFLNGAMVPWRESPNYAPRPRGMFPALIVLHATEGDFDGAVAWLRHPDSRVSAHFVISRAGEIVQLVPLAMMAWHAGTSAWHGRATRGSVNAFSIGIELEHRDGAQDWPEAQVNAVAVLCRSLLLRFGLPATAVVGHAEVALPPGRKRDPVDFPWETLHAQLGSTAVHPVPALVLGHTRVEGRIIQQTLFVPARAVCEALHLEARWDARDAELVVAEST